MPEPGALKARLPAIVLGVVIALLVLAGVWFVLKSLKTKDSKNNRTVQTVQIVRPPPPPPPPPEKQPPPPPPEKQEHLDQPPPEPTPNDEPPPDNSPLETDAPVGAGDSGFGLAHGEGGLVGGGGRGGSPFGRYQSFLAGQLTDKLSADPRLKTKKYSLSVRMSIDGEGRITNVEMLGTTGDAKLDKAIQSALVGVQRLSEPPPPDMPQPVTLHIGIKS